MPQVAVMAHLHALRGWAQLDENLPSENSSAGDSLEKAWRCFDQLILDFYSGVDSGRSPEVWERLLADLAPEAIQVLHAIHSAERTRFAGTTFEAHLLTAHPQESRTLFEWALNNVDSVTASGAVFARHGIVEFIILTLGRIGTESAANRLRELRDDSEVGVYAVNAILEIERRSAP